MWSLLILWYFTQIIWFFCYILFIISLFVFIFFICYFWSESLIIISFLLLMNDKESRDGPNELYDLFLINTSS